MTEVKQFHLEGEALSNHPPYHYAMCGLDDVYLSNGFEITTTDDGEAVTIANIDGLHDAIAMHIVKMERPLRPREFRFLRKEMNLTQEQLANKLGVDGQTIARYEKDITAIPVPTDFMVRLGFMLAKYPKDEQREILQAIFEAVGQARSASTREPLYFHNNADEWGYSEAA